MGFCRNYCRLFWSVLAVKGDLDMLMANEPLQGRCLLKKEGWEMEKERY